MKAVLNGLQKAELTLLVVLLLAMLLTSVTQIVLRNFYNEGIIWAESFVRVLVLWTALLGAMIASRQASHIAIDLVFKFASDQARYFISRLVFLATAIICFITTYYCFMFVYIEYQDNVMAFSKVPSWISSSIMPLAFFVIGMRYLIFSVNPKLVKPVETA